MSLPRNKKKSWGRRTWGLTALLAFCLGLWYLAWRATATLNGQDSIALGISITLYLAEIYGFVAFVLFYLQSRQGLYRKSMISKDYPSVDIFITIYNESLNVLQRTLVCCRMMDYPHDKKNIYVLDDGNRPEVRKLAEKLGCIYLNRPTRDFAKAGNLNHGLAQSGGDLVAILDCDHVPVRSFLKETVGFFEDPKVAIVQTPHYFYNPDTFQRNLRLEQKLANEQDLFFRVIEPGRDYYNAAFFAGSSGVFRRSALKEIGGIQTLTLTEDLHTSMVLHSRGYKSVYVPKVLAAGLAPESFESYLKQRKRWTRGGIQVFLLDNPIWKAGLTFAQRIQYFSALYYFFHGIPRLIYLSAPLAYLLFGYAPLVADLGSLALHFTPYYVVSLIAFQQAGGRARNSFWSDVYETAMCFSITTTAFSTLLSPWRTNFQVTPKGIKRGAKRFDIRLVLPHLGLSALLLVGGIIGIYDLVTYRSSDATSISLFWATYNLFLLGTAISVARERRQIRSAPRLPRMIPGEIRGVGNGSPEATERIPCVTSDLSETGASLIVIRPCSLPSMVKLSLLGDSGEQIHLQGMVMRNDLLPTGEVSIGIHFTRVSDEGRQALIRLMFSHPRSWESTPQVSVGVRRSLMYLFIAPLRTFFREKVFQRFSPRFPEKISCQLVTHDRAYPAVTEDISATGMRISLGPTVWIPAEEAAHLKEVVVRLRPAGGKVLELPGRVVWKISHKGTVLGIRFLEERPDIFPVDEQDLLQKTLEESRS